MKIHSVDSTNTTLNQLAAAYKQCFESSLKAEPSEISLLRYLNSRRKNIATMREGPEDAQKRTFEKLEIASNVDMLIDTNY